ncbi:9214_t:CDS:1 [Funneliformis geosporum]|uniref:9214_t:CDS:1 n=1 Tax=Funneliformis geosporum TaxID=1117311 RepID=A0A9W4SYG3_9GLOM|nr:9214_t:CDS:1 [Funneliformis geosporum]
MDMDLKKYIKENHNQITWKQKNYMVCKIIKAICKLHKENIFHKDLHSGNVLYLEEFSGWYISDLEFCDPANKPSGSIYGNLPYVAPEVILGKGYTFASDIYSIGMLMWEISSGQPLIDL